MYASETICHFYNEQYNICNQYNLHLPRYVMLHITAKLNVILKVRAGLHEIMSPLTERRVNKNKKPAVKDYFLLSWHVCSFYGFTRLNYESRKFKPLVRESLFFTNNKLLLNKQIKSRKLHLFKFSFTFAIFFILNDL